MIQFTQEQVKDFRSRGERLNTVIDWLLDQTKTVRAHELVIPQTGCATWELYYYCPECSVELEFDIDSPKEYRCPMCGKLWRGEPYEGAWWAWLNEFNYTNTSDLSRLYLLTGDEQYARRAKEIIAGYAKYYPDYKVHGDIPYNKPGRANSQVLDEATLLRSLALSYDIIEDTLTEDEKKLVKENLFAIGAAHLREYRTDQLHNHEVDIDSAMAVLGIILDDTELVEHALYEKYGLYYQLEKGMLEDGFWFECSTSYHFYALTNFFKFEKFALNTRWSNIRHPNYRKMFLFACKLLKSDYHMPALNDCMKHVSYPDAYSVFEFAYNMFGDKELLSVLQDKYKNTPRSGIDAFLYGVRELPAEKAELEIKDYHNENGSGLTALHRAGDQYLLIKHGPYGGEHDHYDKLELSYSRKSKPVSEDLGTTGYGAVLHYGYYKNTISHNTVTLNEANQAPACGRVNRFENHGDYSLLDCAVTWNRDYECPDSFIIRQWDTEAYDGADFRRQVIFADDYIIDVEKVKCPESRKIDSSLHFSGRLVSHSGSSAERKGQKSALGAEGPYKYFTNCSVYGADKGVHAVYEFDEFITDVYTMPFDGEVIFTQAPGNPSVCDIPYLIERAQGREACFVHVIACREASTGCCISNVKFAAADGRLTVSLACSGVLKQFSFEI